MRGLAAAALALAATVGLGSACTRVDRPPDVVLITLDTTRWDHLGAYGYDRGTTPALDAFARDAVVYERAWSTSTWTLPAHASLFTGLHPTSHGAHFAVDDGDAFLGDAMAKALRREFGTRRPGPRVNRLGDEHVTLAEVLSQAGWETAAFAGGPWLSPIFGLLQGYGHQDAKIDSMSGRSAVDLTDRAVAWLRAVPREQPVHLLVNYFDAHYPYEPQPGYDELPAAKRPIAVRLNAGIAGVPLSPEQREAYVDRYDGEIRYMDEHVGRLLDALRDAGRFDDAVIVVVADHGELFGEHGTMAHGRTLYEEVLRVPLLVRYPGGRGSGTRVTDPVSVVDVPAWIAAETGTPLPEASDALAVGSRELVVAEVFRDAHSIRLYGARFDRDLRAAIRWPWKLIRSDAGQTSLFDLDADPRESEDRAGEAAVAAELDAQLAAAVEALRPPEHLEPPGDVPPETLEQLRALGYGDGSGADAR